MYLLELEPLFLDKFASFTAEDRRQVAEVLSGRRLQGTSLISLSPEEWRLRWLALGDRASREQRFNPK